jgi:sulfotransferase family protein
MAEVVERPDHINAWYRASQGAPIDWTLFDDFRSVVDWPAVRYWRELADHFPDAPIILTAREPESWYKSAYETIYQRINTPAPAHWPQERRTHRAMAKKIVLEDTFQNRFEDKAHAIAVYERHIEDVRASIRPSRLLEFHPRDGWEPLCRFLGVPVPDEPFPRLNDTASFKAWVAEGDAEAEKAAAEQP